MRSGNHQISDISFLVDTPPLSYGRGFLVHGQIQVRSNHMTSPDSFSPEAEASSETTSSQRLEELARTSTTLARRVAQNPSASAQILHELSYHHDRTTRQYVTANPNTPTESLLELAADFPQTFLDNPIFSLLYLEQPHFIQTLPTQTAVKLLQCEQAPTSWLQQVSIEVRQILAKSRSTPITILGKLADDRTCWVCQAVAQNPRTPTEYLIRLADNTNSSVRWAVAGNPHTPIEYLIRLADDGDHLVRWAVASNPQTPAALLERLVGDDNDRVRWAVAQNPHTPVALLDRFVRDGNRRVRQAVADNPQAPVSILERLAGDRHVGVRLAAARNQSTPAALLEKLASDRNRRVRLAVAEHRHTPAALLEKLAIDENQRVREAVARNPNNLLATLQL